MIQVRLEEVGPSASVPGVLGREATQEGLHVRVEAGWRL